MNIIDFSDNTRRNFDELLLKLVSALFVLCICVGIEVKCVLLVVNTHNRIILFDLPCLNLTISFTNYQKYCLEQS